jgi:hypothetical protein
MPDPALCTETANPNYTFGTGEIFLTPAGELEFSLGNVISVAFVFTPNLLEHRRGIDNSLDAIYAIGKDYTFNFTADEITSQNLGVLLNEDLVDFEGGCQVPFTGDRCTRNYGVRFVHEFPCEDKTVTIVFWRAVILAELTLEFTQTGFAQFGSSIRALNCSSAHPTQPYGYLEVSGACPAS